MPLTRAHAARKSRGSVIKDDLEQTSASSPPISIPSEQSMSLEDTSELQSCESEPTVQPPKQSRARSSKGKNLVQTTSTELRIGGLNRFRNEEERKKYPVICKRGFAPCKSVDYSTLNQLNIRAEFDTLVGIAGWQTYVSLDCHAYVELIREFYTTFKFRHTRFTNLFTEGVVEFWVMNHGYSGSIADFCCLMGFVTKAEVKEPEFVEAQCSYCPEFNASDVWKEWSTDPNPYNPSSSKSSFLKRPVMKYLQRFLAYNYSGRKDAAGTINKQELFFLWCLDNGIRVNMGFWLLNQFAAAAKRTEKPLILGSIITFLAMRLHLVDPADNDLTIACPMAPLDMAALERMCMICQQPDGTFAFVEPGQVKIPAKRALKRKKQGATSAGNVAVEQLQTQVESMQRDMHKLQKCFLKLAEHQGLLLSSDSDSD